MPKKSRALLCAAVLTGALLAPQPARADISTWWIVPIFLGGMWVGGQILSTPAYGHPPYAYYPAAAPGAGPRNCWTEQRNIEGRMRTVQVCY